MENNNNNNRDVGIENNNNVNNRNNNNQAAVAGHVPARAVSRNRGNHGNPGRGGRMPVRGGIPHNNNNNNGRPNNAGRRVPPNGRGPGPNGPGAQRPPAAANPAAVVAPVVAAPVRTFALNAKAWGPSVARDNKDLLAKFAVIGIVPFVRSVVVNISKHPVSAGIRGFLAVKALAFAYETSPPGGHRVCDVYGTVKFKELADHLNIGVPDPMQVVTYRPILVGADLPRVRGCVLVDRVPVDMDLVMMDVYECGDVPFDQSWLEIHLGIGQKLFWMGFCRLGPAGVHAGEGAWYRDNNSVYHRADHETPTSYVHPPCDWIWLHSVHRCRDGTVIIWNAKHQIGSMFLVWFERLVAPNVVDGPQFPTEHFTFADTQVVDWTAINSIIKNLLFYMPPTWYASFLPKRTAVVHLAVVRKLKTSMMMRPKNLHTLRQLAVMAAAEVNNQPDCRVLMQVWPNQFRDLALNCTHAAFFDQIQDDGAVITDLVNTYGPAQQDYNIALKSLDVPHVHKLPWSVLLSFGVGLYFAYRVKRIIPWHKYAFASIITPEAVSSLHIGMAASVYEEVAKSVPIVSKWFGTLEYLHKIVEVAVILFRQQKSGVEIFASCCGVAIAGFPAYCMHEYTVGKPFLERVWTHFCFNVGMWCLLYRPWSAATMFCGFRTQDYASFRQRYYYDEWESRHYENVPHMRTTQFDAKISATPTSLLPYWVKTPLPCDLMVKKGAFNFPGRDPNTHFYWILPTSVPGFVPSRSDENLEAVINLRIMVAPPLDPVVQAGHWKKVDCLVRTEAPIVRDFWVDEWVSHFTDSMHKKKYARALSIIAEHGVGDVWPACDRVKVMIKCDELLTKGEDLCGDFQYIMKPRLIANVHELPQAWVGPELYAAVKNLKNQWSVKPDPWEVADHLVFITYGGACSDQELTDWAEFALLPKRNAWHVIVAGDDSLVVEWHAWAITIYEGDARMFDQSQSYGPLKHQYLSLKRLGVSGLSVDILDRLSRAPYVAKSRDPARPCSVTVSRQHRPIRNTGGGDTSCGNSLVMAHAIVYALKTDRTDLKKGFDFLGFDMKIKTFSAFGEATFLKGMWYRVNTDFGYYWGPLPSRILKVGKSLKDPKVLYRSHTQDTTEASRLFVNDVACGYSFFLQVPLLRMFVRSFKTTDMILDVQEAYSVLSQKSRKPIILEEAWFQLEGRYGVSRDVFLSAESLYATEVFSFMEHPIYHILNLVDYN